MMAQRLVSFVFVLFLFVRIRLLLQLQWLPGYSLYLTGKHGSLLLISLAVTHRLPPLTRPGTAHPPVLGTSHIPVIPVLFWSRDGRLGIGGGLSCSVSMFSLPVSLVFGLPPQPPSLPSLTHNKVNIFSASLPHQNTPADRLYNPPTAVTHIIAFFTLMNFNSINISPSASSVVINTACVLRKPLMSN